MLEYPFPFSLYIFSIPRTTSIYSEFIYQMSIHRLSCAMNVNIPNPRLCATQWAHWTASQTRCLLSSPNFNGHRWYNLSFGLQSKIPNWTNIFIFFLCIVIKKFKYSPIVHVQISRHKVPFSIQAKLVWVLSVIMGLELPMAHARSPWI